MIHGIKAIAARGVHAGMDSLMCCLMNVSQWQLRGHAVTRKRLEEYLAVSSRMNLGAYYAIPRDQEWRRDGRRLSWDSPIRGSHGKNNTAAADLFEVPSRREAPTVILLHALMSANDRGYRRIAAHFNARGWNVLFPHLPYHYSRRPGGHANGSLAITSDLVRNAETLRQAVIELRQLIGWARQGGSGRIALLATSYGAWVAALTLALEETDFTILLQPVADVGHATFTSPASRVMAGLLHDNGIDHSCLDRHAHLIEPRCLTPLTPGDRITIIGGKHDRLSPPASLRSLCMAWGGSRYCEVDQGHFGYNAMRRALSEAELFLDKPSRPGR